MTNDYRDDELEATRADYNREAYGDPCSCGALRWGADCPVCWRDEQDGFPPPQCGHEPVGTSGVYCTKPLGHAGDHGDKHETWACMANRTEAEHERLRALQAAPAHISDDDIPF